MVTHDLAPAYLSSFSRGYFSTCAGWASYREPCSFLATLLSFRPLPTAQSAIYSFPSTPPCHPHSTLIPQLTSCSFIKIAFSKVLILVLEVSKSANLFPAPDMLGFSCFVPLEKILISVCILTCRMGIMIPCRLVVKAK